MAAAIARIGIGRGINGVVVILGVGRIDGDERHVAPVFATSRGDHRRGVSFSERGVGENMRNAVGMNGDQAHRALGLE